MSTAKRGGDIRVAVYLPGLVERKEAGWAMDPVELFRFLLALALTPVLFAMGRRIAVPAARTPFLVGYVALLIAFGLRFIQTTPLETDVVRVIVHAGYAAGGFGFAWAAWQLRRHVLAMWTPR